MRSGVSCATGLACAVAGAPEVAGRVSVGANGLAVRADSTSCCPRFSRKAKIGRGDRWGLDADIENWSAEIAEERRAKDGAGIVAGKAGETIRHGTAIRRDQVLRLSSVARLKRIDQRAVETDADDEAEPGQHLAREPRNRGGSGRSRIAGAPVSCRAPSVDRVSFSSLAISASGHW